MTSKQLQALLVSIVYFVVIVWMATTDAQRRLWAMKTIRCLHRTASRWATSVGAFEMRREASGRAPAYELSYVLSVARDRLAGVYDQLRAS